MDRFRVWQKLHRGWRLIINCETRLITLITIRVLVRARSRVLTRGNYTSVGTIWIYDYVGEKKGGEESRWESRPRSAIREDTVAFITKQCHDITKIHLNKTIEGNKLSRSIHWRKKNTKMIRLFYERILQAFYFSRISNSAKLLISRSSIAIIGFYFHLKATFFFPF